MPYRSMRLASLTVALFAAAAPLVAVPAQATTPLAADRTVIDDDANYSTNQTFPGVSKKKAKLKKYADITQVWGGHDGTDIFAKADLKAIPTPQVLRDAKLKHPPTFILRIDVKYDDPTPSNINQFTIAEVRVTRKGMTISKGTADYDYLQSQGCVTDIDLNLDTATLVVNSNWHCDLDNGTYEDGTPIADGDSVQILVSAEIMEFTKKPDYSGLDELGADYATLADVA